MVATDMLGVQTTFVSQKVRHVKWLDSDLMLSGSWDEEENSVRLFGREQNSVKECSAFPTHSDVSGLEVASKELVLVSTVDCGDVFLLAVDKGARKLFRKAVINLPLRRSCQALASLDGLCASASDSGSIDLLNVATLSAVRSFEKVESATINDLVFAHYNELVTASSRGSIKVFDLKSSSQKASSQLTLSSSSEIGIACLGRHPSQSHVLASGNCDGTLAFFDLRKTGYPITILKPHERTINHVRFHPLQPEHLFTCSEKGELLHWDASSLVQINFGGGAESRSDVVWFQAETVQRRVHVSTTLSTQCLPLNSLDVAPNGDLVAGGDNEALYVVPNAISQRQ